MFVSNWALRGGQSMSPLQGVAQGCSLSLGGGDIGNHHGVFGLREWFSLAGLRCFWKGDFSYPYVSCAGVGTWLVS